MSARTILLVGCGRWGRHILRDLGFLGCRTVVVARSESSVARAREGGAAQIVASALDAPRVDGAIVATPTDLHEQSVAELLPREIPIFVEKPLTPDPAGARRLVERAGDRIFVMDKWRYHPGVEALAAIRRSGELGDVIGLKTTRVGWGVAHQDADTAWHLAPHDLSIALEILGRLLEPRAAVAEMEEGAVTGLTAISGEAPWHLLEVSARRPKNLREVRLICSRGSAVLPESYSETVSIYRSAELFGREPIVETRSVGGAMPLLAELRTFVGYLDGGPPPRSSASEALMIVDTLARMRELAGLDGARPAGSVRG